MTTRPPAPAAAAGEDRSARIAVTVFPALILAAAAFAFFLPDTGQLVAPYTSIFLGIIMFAMGLTLTVPDFTRVAKHPLPILVGVIAQFLIMPLVGLGLEVRLQRPPELAMGVFMVGSAAGATA